MAKQNQELVDVTRLYSLRYYSEVFGIPYGTVYSKYNTTVSGRAREPFTLIHVSGTDMIYVSPEEEKKLLGKTKGGK